jgi:hypothetical protein
MPRPGASKFAILSIAAALPDAVVMTHVEPLGYPESCQDVDLDR